MVSGVQLGSECNKAALYQGTWSACNDFSFVQNGPSVIRDCLLVPCPPDGKIHLHFIIPETKPPQGLISQHYTIPMVNKTQTITWYNVRPHCFCPDKGWLYWYTTKTTIYYNSGHDSGHHFVRTGSGWIVQPWQISPCAALYYCTTFKTHICGSFIIFYLFTWDEYFVGMNPENKKQQTF